MKFIVALALFIAVAVATPSASIPKVLMQRSAETETRIIGGETVSEDPGAPYLVSISLSKISYAHNCAGTIIGKEWVLTAAHCVNEIVEIAGDMVGIPVYAGLKDRTYLEGAQIRYVDWSFNNKKFTGEEGSDDIALLHVSEAFVFSANVQQASLPYTNEDYEGQEGVIYGWGLNSATDEVYVKDLQKAKATVLNQEDCKTKLPSEAPVSEAEICATVLACYGDGGSPLVVERAGGVSELIGITSWGYLPCTYASRPTAFTAVSKFVEWIAEVQWAYYILH